MATLSRFCGCLVGAVVGDCIGEVYEGTISKVSLHDITKTVSKIESNFNKKQNKNSRLHHFTDDTAMARSVATSLIQKKEFDAKDLAKRFAEAYMAEPFRGYGQSVVTVFDALNDPKLEDVFQPARDQFDGKGSYGNGGAMRIAPAGVFAYSQKYNAGQLQELATKITQLTHTHIHAIHGAILECTAVELALQQDSAETLKTDTFLDSLTAQLKPLEEEVLRRRKEDRSKTPPLPDERESDTHDLPYCYKLEMMRQFLKRDVDAEKIIEVLGNDVSALGSVPAAVYSFLRSTKEIPGLEKRNAFERTIMYAISLGGDTDTIATMAGAIAGALYGLEAIPHSWQAACEGVSDAKQFAEELFKMNSSTKD